MIRMLLRETEVWKLWMVCAACTAVFLGSFWNQGTLAVLATVAIGLAVTVILTALGVYFDFELQDELLEDKPIGELLCDWQTELERADAELSHVEKEYKVISAQRASLRRKRDFLAGLLLHYRSRYPNLKTPTRDRNSS